MQCNTNYTGSLDNFRYVNLNVLKHFQLIWPGIVTGLSDHTPGHSAILGAITLGARVIEKHFTDDNERAGPDHSFALNPVTWKNMIDASRELEYALGNGIKQIEENEAETKVIQRRAIRMAHDLSAGHTLTLDDFDFLRPCPANAISPMLSDDMIGRKLTKNVKRGEALTWDLLEL